VEAPDAVRVTLLPEQKVVEPEGVITTVGNGFTVTTTEAVPVQPPALVPVTIYVPPVVAVMAAVVAPLDHT
jgi:hypothetical protein